MPSSDTTRYFQQIPSNSKLSTSFPLNFIVYPAFFSNACSENLLGIISNHVVDMVKDERDTIDDHFYTSKIAYASFEKSSKDMERSNSWSIKDNQSAETRGKSCTDAFPKTPQNFKDDFDMEAIITPSSETAKSCAKKIRKNTSTSLLTYNEQTRKEIEKLNRAKIEFIRLQQYKRKAKIDRLFDAKRNGLHLGDLENPTVMHQPPQNIVHGHEHSPTHSKSASHSPVFGEILQFDDDSIVGKQELRDFMANNNKNGCFDLIATVFTLLNYFKRSGRWVNKVNKKSYGFTIKIKNANKESALEFITDLETHSDEPIKFCTITHKKDYYNFHVSCANQEQVEIAINILMKKYYTSKLSFKVFEK